MNISSIIKKINGECRMPHYSAGKLGSAVSKTMCGSFLRDITSHGFIALKESGFQSRHKYNSIVANLAEYQLLHESYPDQKDLVDLSRLALTSKNMDIIEAKDTIPTLALLFFKPQPEIYANMLKTADGCDFMEWLGVGEGGVLNVDQQPNFSHERHLDLSRKFLGNRLEKNVHIPTWIRHIANVTSVVTLQYQICKAGDFSESRKLIAKRLGALLEACGQHVDHAYINNKLDGATYPFPSLWKKHGVVDAAQFLGYTVPWNCITGTISTFTWGNSPLGFYFDNDFFKLKPLEDFTTLNEYIDKIKLKSLEEDRLCSEAMLYLIYAEYHNVPAGEMYSGLYHANKTKIPNFQNPAVRHYLSSESEEAGMEFEVIFQTALDQKTAKGYADLMLENLKYLKPQSFNHHADAYMMASPRVQAIRKLFPYLEDPNRFADRLPNSLLESQLASDLGL